MFIYHLVREESRSDYDIPNQYIIVAKDAAKARKIAEAHDRGIRHISPTKTSADWLNTEYSTCKKLGLSSTKTERIVLVEVHEG